MQHAQHVDLVITEYGRRLLIDELGQEARVDRLQAYLEETWGEGVRRGGWVLHSNKDLGARIASGSKGADAMVIVPCSMKTMAASPTGCRDPRRARRRRHAQGTSAADHRAARDADEPAATQEHGQLCAEAGATMVPAMPGFYQRPQTIDDLADFMAGRILSLLRIDHQLYPAWDPQAGRQ